MEQILSAKLVCREHFYLLAVKEMIRLLGNCGVCLPTNKENKGAKVSEQTISKRKKAKEELERSNLRIADFLGSIPESFYVLDFDWNFVYVNKIAADTLGKKPEDLIGKNYWKLYPKQLGSAAEENFRWTMEKREIRKFEFHSLYFDIWSQVTVTPTAEGISMLATNITDRKKAEEELIQTSEREHFLAQLVRDASVAVGVGYPDGRLGLVNDAFEKLTGYSREELQKIDWNVILTPSEYREYEKAKLTEVNQTKKPVRYEKEYIRKDGSRVPIELTVHPFLDKEGNVTSYFSFIMDITDRKKAEEKLRQSEERFRIALKNAPVSVAVQDCELRYIWAYNQKTAQPEQIIGKLDSEIFTPEEAAHLDAIKGRVLKEGVELREQQWFNRPSGPIFLDVTWTPLYDSKSQIIGVSSATIDLTDMKRAEIALQESEQRWSTTLSSIGDAVIATDTSGKTTFMNHMAEELTGWTLSEGSQKPVKEVFNIVNEQTRLEVENPIAKVLREGIVVGLANHTVLIRKDGSEIPIDDSGAPIKDKDGKTTGVVLIFRDISERKKAEESLTKKQDELQTIIDSSQGLIFYKDCENRFIRVNKAFAKIMGLPKEQLEGRSLFELYPKEEAEAFWIDDKQVIASGKAKVGIEEKMQSKQGQRWVQTDKIPYRDAEGNIIGVIGFSTDITERKKAEEALKDSGERLQQALEAGELGLWGLDVITGKAWRTLQHDKIFGYNSLLPEWTYQIFLSHVLPEDRAMVDEKFGGAISKGNEWNFECRIQIHDGQQRWIWAQGRPKFDEKHAVVQMIGLVKDITERKQAEEKVNQSMKTFLELIERAPFGIYVINSEFRIAQMNKGSQNGAFRNVRPLIGRDFSEAMHILWPEPTASEIIAHFRHTLETGEPYYSPQFINPRHDVEIVESYEWELQRIRLPDGQYGVICYYFDSTKMRETERVLYKAQAKLKNYTENLERLVEERTKKLEITSLYARNLIEASLDPLVTISAEGKITDVNKATEQVTGCSRKQLIGSDFSDYFTEPEKAKIGYKRVFSEGFITDYPLAIKHKSGKVTEVLYNATVYRNAAGEMQGVFAAARDITERKKAEEQAQEAAKKLKDSERLAAIGATAGMVGHDIRNPLQAITGDLYLAKTELAALPENEQKLNALESLEEIEHNIDYINKIVADLQDYARPLNPRAQETNIKSVFNDILAKNGIPKNIKVTVKVEDKAEKIMADPDYLKRIAANLTLNAIQAMPNGGKLTIRTYVEEQTNDVLITVKDTGVGIPEDIKPKLFTPMMTTKSKGQGFGLAVVKRMTEGIGGTVAFESIEGKGTTFTVRLPPPKELNGKLVYK